MGILDWMAREITGIGKKPLHYDHEKPITISPFAEIVQAFSGISSMGKGLENIFHRKDHWNKQADKELRGAISAINAHTKLILKKANKVAKDQPHVASQLVDEIAIIQGVATEIEQFGKKLPNERLRMEAIHKSESLCRRAKIYAEQFRQYIS